MPDFRIGINGKAKNQLTINSVSMDKQISHSLQILKAGGTLVYPTDTVWGLGCDATDEKAVSKIFAIKKRKESKSLIVLVDGFAMLQRYIPAIPNIILDFLKTVKKSTTVIYNNPMGLARNVMASNNTVAIRIVKDGFCHELVKQFDRPIVSTSVNISDNPAPKSFKEIDTSLLDAVDYVVNLPQNKPTNTPSTILKIGDSGQLEVIRD